MSYLLGIDLGTSSLKAIVIDESGNVKAQSSYSYQFSSPNNSYAEQDVSVWWKACCTCIKNALDMLADKGLSIAAVSFSGQMHGLVAFDKNYEVIRPAILHCDARATAQVEKMKSLMDEDFIVNEVRNPIYTGFLLPSLLWVRDNEPAYFEKIRYVCLPKDYLRFKLCGEFGSDYSDSSGTLAYDIENLCWSKRILSKVDIQADIFPECLDTFTVVGKVTKQAAEETGLREGTLVVNGGGDQIMQAIGNGITQPGTATVNIGSSGQVCFQSNHPIKNPALNTNSFCGCEKGRWIAMGATMSAGLSLSWINRLLNENDYERMNENVSKVRPGSGGLIFLPYLNGERTPHVNPNLSAMFMGMNVNTGRPEVIRAVMEGVAFSLMQCIEILSDLGLKAESLVASGGGARSKPWLQLQADIYNKPIKVAVNKEQAGVGAAIAAGVGAGIYATVEEGCKQAIRYEEKIYEPNPINHAIYEEYYQLFKDAYISSSEVLSQVTEMGRRV